MSLKPFDSAVLKQYSAFVPVVDPNELVDYSIKFLVIGFILVIAFVSYEVTHTTVHTRSLVKEFTLASSASIMLGVGALMGMLGAGLYV